MLLLPIALLAFALLFVGGRGWRDAALCGCVLFGLVLALVTEGLGTARLLGRGPLLLAWGLLLLPVAWLIAKNRETTGAGLLPRGLWGRILSCWPIFNRPVQTLLCRREEAGWKPASRIESCPTNIADCLIAAGIAAISAITLVTAIISPPNSADAMAYHMPRVIYWAQFGTVSFFPTSYYAQISLQPLAEYFTLHTYLLSGSDRFANLVQWLGSFGCLIGVSLIARLLGAGTKGQLFAALFCATLPNGILQASSAKNDYLLALWLVAMCYFAIRYSQRSEGRVEHARPLPLPPVGDLIAMSVALGLALLTKATAYLFAPAMLLGILRGRALRAAPVLAAGVLLLNGPHYWRNFELSGSPLGYDSAQGDGFFRWRNETFGWRQTVSNVLRNTSEQLGARSPEWNHRVYGAVLRAHQWLGIDPNDSATTWRWTTFAPPKNTNHEADANNRWHGLLLIAAFLYVAWRRRAGIGYMLAIPLAFVLFCAYLKWQPFLARMFLPLFVLGSPLAGLALEKLRPPALQAIVCLFLLNNTRPYIFENWVRPWKGPNSIWKTTRDRQYFNDMDQWGNRASYERSVEALQNTHCNLVGIDISQFPIEYPFQALLRERRPQVRFVHVGVDNATARYALAAEPCAVLCMNCERIDRYSAFGPPTRIDRFVLFATADARR